MHEPNLLNVAHFPLWDRDGPNSDSFVGCLGSLASGLQLGPGAPSLTGCRDRALALTSPRPLPSEKGHSLNPPPFPTTRPKGLPPRSTTPDQAKEACARSAVDVACVGSPLSWRSPFGSATAKSCEPTRPTGHPPVHTHTHTHTHNLLNLGWEWLRIRGAIGPTFCEAQHVEHTREGVGHVSLSSPVRFPAELGHLRSSLSRLVSSSFPSIVISTSG